MRIFEHRVAKEEEGRTIKSLALGEIHLSRSQFSSLKFHEGLLLDGEPVRANVRVREGQLFKVQLPEAIHTMEAAYDLPLTVPYTDEDYFVIEKPAPLPTLSSRKQTGPTLENVFYSYLGCPENYLFRPVNRLDKGTSGLMAAARNAHAQQLLQRQLHSDEFIREYLAVCRGVPKDDRGTVNLPIARVGEGNMREVCPEGRPAVTHYQVEEARKGLSLVRLRLETGRTHQIRVHMKALGCPVLGDYLYDRPHPSLPGRFALHACLIQFDQPISGKRVRLESLPPEEWLELTLADEKEAPGSSGIG